eukprot:GHVU01082002.1.p1 GENE.GHVU01082002.1~~GHVU01082002.1.p1  ORF type:complete len:152 (+),score=18.63 GHVU01082002.1:295-750(+)
MGAVKPSVDGDEIPQPSCSPSPVMSDGKGGGGKRVGVVHLDLGIGGAERLIVLLSLAAQRLGNDVQLFTSYHDRGHAFPETIDGTLRVRAFGQWIPRSVCGRFTVLMSTLRMLWVTLCMLFTGHRDFDVIVVDGVSAVNPLLSLMCRKEGV